LWVKAGTLDLQATFDRIFECRFDNDNDVQFNVDDAGSITFGVIDAGTAREVSANGLSTDTWYHLIGTWDASENTVTFYVNLIEQSDTVSGAWGTGDTTELRMGSRTDDTGEYDGLIDDVRIYNILLDADQRAELYNNGNGTEE